MSLDKELRSVYTKHARVQVDYSRQLDGEWGKLLAGESGKRVVGASAVKKDGDQDADVMMI